MFDSIKERLHLTFQKDFNVIREYGMFEKLEQKMQNDLIKLLFGDFISLFEEFFDGCERSFINATVSSLSYKLFEHN